VAFATIRSEALLQFIFGQRFVYFGLILAELGLVVALSAAIHRLSYATAGAMFLIYSGLNGLTLSVILLVYTTASLASTFFITAGTFLAVSLYGYSTRRDLSSLGSLAFMGLIGIIIASIVNFFLKSSMLGWIISYIGVAVFTGLTAYDTQKLKQMHESGMMRGENGAKMALLGALRLYLDFVNLFLMLLRILGNRR
jgi:FtsH-binding integral membrane protein